MTLSKKKLTENYESILKQCENQFKIAPLIKYIVFQSAGLALQWVILSNYCSMSCIFEKRNGIDEIDLNGIDRYQ